jgi:hypothetical protein
VGDHIPPSSIGPGRGIGPGGGMGAASTGPERMRRRLGGPGGKESSLQKGGRGLGKDPSMMPTGHGVFGRTSNVEKDGDPLSRRSPNKKPGNNSFF